MSRINMNESKGDTCRIESLPGEPRHEDGILASGEQQRGIAELSSNLSEYKDRLRFEQFYHDISASILFTASSTDKRLAFTTISGLSGGSYSSSIPVKCGISPARAFLYSPLGSRFSQTSSGVSIKTSVKSSRPTISPRQFAHFGFGTDEAVNTDYSAVEVEL
jgi:hypothetical protein